MIRGAWRLGGQVVSIDSRANGRRVLTRNFESRSGRPATDGATGTEEAMSETDLSTKQSQTSQEARLPSSHVDPRRAGDHQGQTPQRSSPPVGLIWRVERRNTFEALRRARRRRAGPITVSWVAGDPAEPPRVGYTIGRRVGSAVVRNRVRRRLRMLIREAAPRLRPGAYLIGVSPDAADYTYDQLRTTLSKALQHLEER
jgi:ribonuclease P protein component